MSLPIDIDEYSADVLKAELKRREKLVAQGRCDYCGRPHAEVPHCKFPNRHYLIHWVGASIGHCERKDTKADVWVDGRLTHIAVASHIENVTCPTCRKLYYGRGRET